MNTEENAPTPPPSTTVLSTPLGREIGRASAAHPSVSDAPPAMRDARRAAVSATAKAMADADDADFSDAEAAVSIAPQVVDEAALALGVSLDRTVPVDLNAETLPRHRTLAATLSRMPRAAAAGYGCPSAIARSEKAIGRVMRIRASEIDHDPDAEAHLVSLIVGAMMRTCIARGVAVNDMDDDQLIALVEDASDLSLGIGGGV